MIEMFRDFHFKELEFEYTFIPSDVAVICLETRISEANWKAKQNSSEIETANKVEP